MPRAGLSPARVVAEAAQLADEVGLDRLTLAAVADRLAVRLPSLYKHVAGLDGLRRELASLGLGELATALGKAAMGRTRRDALVEIAHAYRTFATDRPGLYTATLRAPAPDDAELTARAQEVLDVAFALTRSYGLDGEDAIHAIRILRSAMHGFVTQQAAGAFGMPQSIDDSYDRLIDVLDVAFTTWGSAP
jgi:AcrR family transcriptional regulator